jgi:hypothetical protein
MENNPYTKMIEQDVSGRLPNPYVDIIRRDMEAEDERLMTSLMAASKSDPNKAGEAQRLARELDLPPDLAERNLDEVRAIVRQRAIERQNMMTLSPVLRAQMTDPNFAKIAQDQIDNLSLTEKVFKGLREIPKDAETGWASGRLQSELGLLGERAMRGVATPDEMKRIGAIQSRLRELRGTGGFTEASTKILGQMSYTLPDAVLYGQSMALGAGATALIAGQLGPQVATPEEIFTVPGAMITGFGAGMGARFAEQSARIEAGLQYTEMINEGIDPQVAKYVSSGVGLVNGTLEVIGAGAIAAPFKRLLSKRVTQEVAAAMTKPTVAMAVKEFGKSYATAIGVEVGTEILQEIAGIAGDEIGRAYSKPELESKLTTEEGRAEIAQRIVSVMEEVTKGMAVLALPGAGLNFRSDYRRAQDAKKQTQFFVELTKAANESEVRKRNPDAYQAFIAQQADGTGAENIYIDARQFNQTLRQAGVTDEQLAQVLPDVAPTLAQAVQSGDDIVIPTADYAARIAGTDLGNALMQHARIDPDAMSAAEAVQFQVNKDRILADAERVLQEKMTTDEAFVQSAKTVETRFLEQLKVTGRYTDKVNRDNAAFVRDFVVTQAAQLNMMPEAFYDRYMYRVQASDQPRTAQMFGQEVAREVDRDGMPIATMAEVEAVADIPTVEKVQEAINTVGEEEFSRRVQTKMRSLGVEMTPEREAMATEAVAINIVALNRAAAAPEAGILRQGAPTRPPSEVLADLEAAKFVPDKVALAMLGDFPEYLRGVVEFMVEQRQKLVTGTLTVRDLAKAYYITIASMGADAINVDTVERKTGMKIDPMFINEGKVRPEEAAAAWLLTPEGKQALDELEAGTFNEALWDKGANVRRAFGDDRFATFRAFDENVKGINFRSLDTLLTQINEAGKAQDFAQLEKLVVLLQGIGRGKIGFIKHMLGMGDSPTIDAVEINFWITGQGDIGNLKTKQAKLAREVKAASSDRRVSAELFNRIVDRFDRLRPKMPGGKDIDPGVYQHIMHHWLWDRAKGIETTHAGMYEALRFAQQARGGFDPSRLTTILNEQADVSTFLHETAHFFLTVYADMATMPEATEQMRQDMQTILDWFGVPDLATFNAMSLDEQRQYHEQFAYNFELYMFEGKAPNVKLQGMFDRFAAFLRRIYRSIRDDLNALYREENGRDLPILTGEVRGVMDRMLASEDQIKQAEAVRNMAAMFQTQEQSGMDDAAWTAYQQMMQEARDASVTDLTKASLRQMKWLQNARGRVLKELQAQAKTERDRIRAEVEKEVADEPVYRAMRWLQKGEVTDPQTGDEIKATAGFRLNKAAIAEMYPETALSRPDLTKLRGMTAADGLHPDVVAEMFGFQSGDQLVRSLIDAGPMKAAVDARTDQRMLAENSELVDPAAIELAVEQALHNEARARFVAVELRHLAKATEPVRVMIAAAKLAAQSMLAGKKVGEIRPRDHSIAEGRAAKRSVDAMKAGRSAEAQEAKQAQLIQNQLAAEATRIRQEIAKQLDYMRRVTRDSNRKRMGADAADQIDALLARFELRPVTLREAAQRADLAQWIESQREAGYEPDIAPELVSQAMRVDYRQLTVQQFGDLVSAVEQIEALGRNEQRMITQAKEIAYTQARDEIVLSINENARGRTVQARTARTNAGRAAQKIKGFFSEHLKAAAIARILDGGKDGGPMWTYLISTANERGNNEVKMRAQATQDLTRIMAPLLKNPGMSGNGMVYPSVGRNLNGENRLVIALNWGNESNRQRLMGGEGWTADQITPILQTMTAEELRAVQAIWDYFETYRPLIAAKERRVYGKEPRWIDPAPFAIMSADGQTVEMRGGYYPVKYDPMASERAEAFAEAEEAQRMLRGAYTTATTRRSFTKARVEEVVGRPLLYTLDGLYNGLNDVIHDLNWHEWLIDANKLLRSASIDAAIREQYGPEFKRQLKMWVEDVAVGERGANGAGEMALGWLRQSVSAAGLGFNVMSALQQITGFSSSIVRIGYAAVGRGILKTIGSPAATFKMVNEKSSFMQERSRTQFRELNELRNVIRGQSRAARMVQLGAYVMMMRMQRMVDVPTWVGAYEQAVANGAADVLADGTIDDSKAVALADQTVIDSQGSGMVKDLSKIERGGQAMKLFTVFYSYMNTQFNLLVTSTMTARSRGRLASDYLMLLVAPVVLSLAIKDAAVPSGDDEDDLEKLARTLAAEELSYMMGMMVVLREFAFAGKVLTGAEGGGRGYSGPAGLRAISDIGTLATQASQGEFDTAFRKAAINVLGDFTGLPSAQINRTINGIDALIEGETQNPAAVVLGYQP